MGGVQVERRRGPSAHRFSKHGSAPAVVASTCVCCGWGPAHILRLPYPAIRCPKKWGKVGRTLGGGGLVRLFERKPSLQHSMVSASIPLAHQGCRKMSWALGRRAGSAVGAQGGSGGKTLVDAQGRAVRRSPQACAGLAEPAAEPAALSLRSGCRPLCCPPSFDASPRPAQLSMAQRGAPSPSIYASSAQHSTAQRATARRSTPSSSIHISRSRHSWDSQLGQLQSTRWMRCSSSSSSSGEQTGSGWCWTPVRKGGAAQGPHRLQC